MWCVVNEAGCEHISSPSMPSYPKVPATAYATDEPPPTYWNAPPPVWTGGHFYHNQQMAHPAPGGNGVSWVSMQSPEARKPIIASKPRGKQSAPAAHAIPPPPVPANGQQMLAAMAPATYIASAAVPSQLPMADSTSAGVNPSLAGVDPALVRQLLNENDSLYRENDGLHMQMAELRRQLAAAADEAQKLPAQKQQAQKPQTRSSPQAAPSKTASISPRKVTLAPARPPPVAVPATPKSAPKRVGAAAAASDTESAELAGRGQCERLVPSSGHLHNVLVGELRHG